MSLLDHVFFWQERISYREKIIIATVLLSVMMLVALTGQVLSRRQNARRVCSVVGLLLLILAVSIGRDWLDHEHTVHGVVVQEVTARKGGSTTYEPAFRESLVDGTEFVVIDHQKDWIQIEVGDSATAWIPEKSCVTY